jgi:hypothetical protein
MTVQKLAHGNTANISIAPGHLFTSLTRRQTFACYSPGTLAPWFSEIIERLFNATDFLVNGIAYRFAELEAYYHGPGHQDLFTHRDPSQRVNGRWYFHRTRGRYHF